MVGKAIGRKLSVNEFGFDKPTLQKLVLGDQEAQHFLARFVGVVTGLKPYKTKGDENRPPETAFGLMGSFEGTSVNGEVKEGAVLYLPSYVNDMVVAMLQADESIASIRIAFDVYASYEEKSATSYTFTVNDLLNDGSQSVEEVKSAITALPMPNAVLKIEAPAKK